MVFISFSARNPKLKIMSKFHVTSESRKPTYNELLEELKLKDKQIEDLLIGDREMEESEQNEEEPQKTQVNEFFFSEQIIFFSVLFIPFLCT